MQRRDFLKGVAAITVGSSVAETSAHAASPFDLPTDLPTARFAAGQQHRYPDWAFKSPLFIPPVPLPVDSGSYSELDGKEIFGPADPLPLGRCFHGIAKEWGVNPPHWAPYQCTPFEKGEKAWKQRREGFGWVHVPEGGPQIYNWAHFKVKCYKLSISEGYRALIPALDQKARYFGYNGLMPGPTLKFRLGEPVVVRFENQLEAEMSVHLHGGHSPSHSDGFPTFYVLQGMARDYFYPNILPLYRPTPDELKPELPISKYSSGNNGYKPDVGESQSTMWYHDHAMDATAYNVSKGLAGFAICFGEEELDLIRRGVLPGYRDNSCRDVTAVPYKDGTKVDFKQYEDPSNPGYFDPKHEPYRNPFDLAIVLQDKVIDENTGQIAYDLTGHDGYLGDTFLVNGVAWPYHKVRNRKYRVRVLNGSNARVYRLRLMKWADFEKANRDGIHSLNHTPDPDHPAPDVGDFDADYENICGSYLRIGKDSWLWSKAVQMKSAVLAMANRGDFVVNFNRLAENLKPGEKQEFVLVNTMPQADGRGPKLDLENGGDPRVLPVPFDTQQVKLVELNRPIGLMKFVVHHEPPGSPGDPPDDKDASVEDGDELIKSHRPIRDAEIKTVRQFIFERGKGAWQINGRFYDPYIANAAPILDGAEEWVLMNQGGGWWHPIHIHLESHQLIRYEKDFAADEIVDRQDPPAPNPQNGDDILNQMKPTEAIGLHDTQVLGPNTIARIRMRHRTWQGPFVFHCHNLEHEDMRMMFNFEPVPSEASQSHDPDVAPTARTHGNDLTWNGSRKQHDANVGELEWHYAAIPKTPVSDAGEEQIPPRPFPQ